MNNIEFVEMLRIVVAKSSIRAVKANITTPSGKVPQDKYIVMSSFHNSLSDTDKGVIDLIVKESVDTAIFQFLSVIDGVVSIDNNGGELKLYYDANNEKILLNDSNEDYLHDLYNAR